MKEAEVEGDRETGRCYATGFQDEGRGHQLRNAGSL